MISIHEEDYQIFLGLYTALSRTKSSVRVQYIKILEAQKYFFRNAITPVDLERKAKNLELLDDALHKFYLGSYALEQLWAVQNYLKYSVHKNPNFDSNLTYQQDEITFLLAAIFDQVLYSWRSFLDFYLKYLLFFLTGNYIVTISTGKFRKEITNYINKEPNDKKAELVYDYIRKNVLSKTFDNQTDSWGDLLRDLRDKTAHKKLIKPTIIENKNNQGVMIAWPTIKGLNYSELAQRSFENSAFEMLIKLFPILYEMEWVPGPYKEGMFNQRN